MGSLVCRDCGEVLPAAFLTVDEAAEWKAAHRARTGHEDWVASAVPVDY